MNEPKRYLIVSDKLCQDGEGNLVYLNDPVIVEWKRSHLALEGLEGMMDKRGYSFHIEKVLGTVELLAIPQTGADTPVTAPDLISAIEAAMKEGK
jgi:hypothetical protein